MIERLEILRNSLGLTKADFSKGIGLSRQAFYDMEKGKSNIGERNIKVICSVYGISEIWFKTGEGNMFEPKNSKVQSRFEEAWSIYETLTDNQKQVIDYMMKTMLKSGDLPFEYEKPKPTIYSDDYENLSTEDKKRALCEAVDKEENAKKAAAKYAV